MEIENKEGLASNLTEFSHHIEAAMKVIDRFEQSRPGSMTFTKLEEAMLWFQVLSMNVKLKKDEKVETV